ncbi:hypothetical protein ACQ86G_22760 [Roseateles chitinivorans]|uniref:hypothetical protein n=1 Tax=Roseateles chitinivorans TaxID=2917965 RepID=UPI003D67824E
MDTNQLATFLGHSTVHPPFNDFLAAQGIKKRPKLSDSLPYKVASSVPGLALVFEDSPEAQGMARKSEGQFVFHEIYFDFNPKKEEFVGEMPFGIGAARSLGEVQTAIGAPRVLRDSLNPKFPGAFASYLIGDIVLQFKYADAEGAALKFARIGIRADHHVLHGLA